MGLNARSVPYYHILLYFYEWTYESISTYAAAVKVDGMHDSYVFTELHIYNADISNFGLHRFLTQGGSV